MLGRSKRRVLELVSIATVAGTVVACGGKAMDMVGTVLEDAGRAVSDAGATWSMDAGSMSVDSGHHDSDRDGSNWGRSDSGGRGHEGGSHWLQDAANALIDGGRAMQDGSGHMATDAAAQTACGTCTSAGAQRTIVASEDPERLVGGSLKGTDWTTSSEYISTSAGTEITWIYTAKLADGPLVITDLMQFGNGAGMLFSVPLGTPCFERKENTGIYPVQYLLPAAARTILDAFQGDVHGTHIFLKPDLSVCAYGGDGVSNRGPTGVGELRWSGFRPYD